MTTTAAVLIVVGAAIALLGCAPSSAEDRVAEAIRQNAFERELKLDWLETLDAGTAERVAQWGSGDDGGDRHLHLDSLVQLDAEAAQTLSQWGRGESGTRALYLNGLRSLEPATAEKLAQWGRGEAAPRKLYLDGLLSLTGASALAQWGDGESGERSLSLERVETITDAQADWLVAWEQVRPRTLHVANSTRLSMYRQKSRLMRAVEHDDNTSNGFEQDFTFLREETFAVGGHRHTVRVYRHERFARALGLEPTQTDVAVEFVLIPAGRFTQGSPSTEAWRDSDEGPQRNVSVSAFLLARTPVTQVVWRGLVGDTGLNTTPSHFSGDRRPVEQVSWHDVTVWCWANGLRLPTESEWEFACRAGTTTRFFFGDDDDEFGHHAWFVDNSGLRTHDVGAKTPNAFGLFDVHGNVWEWVQDTYQETYRNAPTDGSAWELPTPANLRVLRGGALNFDAKWCRSAYRIRNTPTHRFYNASFRPAKSLP